MSRPYGLLRAGFPFHKTLGMRRLTNFPIDLALGREDRLFILCRSEGAALIRKYSNEDRDLGAVSIYGTEPGKTQWPVTILADAEENLYLSDEAQHRITVLDAEGGLLDSWGEEGGGDGQLRAPSGMDFDPEGNLYVVDTGNHRVQKFTRAGAYLGQWGSYGCGQGQFNMPWGIAVDELGDVYVADWRNDRVQKFSADGKPLMAFGASGCGDGQFNRPSGVAVDLHGDIYVVDRGNNRVQLFNQEGRYVQKFIGDATLSTVAVNYMLTNAFPNRLRDMANLEIQKLLRWPQSVVVSQDGLMYVPDTGSYRVQVYRKEFVELDQLQFAPPQRAPSLTI